MSRGITITAPLVAELDKPIPTIIMVIVTEIAMVVSFTFPSKEEDDYEFTLPDKKSE